MFDEAVVRRDDSLHRLAASLHRLVALLRLAVLFAEGVGDGARRRDAIAAGQVGAPRARLDWTRTHAPSSHPLPGPALDGDGGLAEAADATLSRSEAEANLSAAEAI